MRPLCLLILFAAGCSSFSVDTDYDAGADFSKYRTWSWFSGPKPYEPGLDGLTEQRIRAAVEAQLPGRGLGKAESGDLLVTFHVSVNRRIEVTPTTVGFGYGWGPAHVGYSTNDVRTYDEGTLILDLVDAKTRHLVWRGTARGTVHQGYAPEERTQRINEAVHGILENYPPANPPAK